MINPYESPQSVSLEPLEFIRACEIMGMVDKILLDMEDEERYVNDNRLYIERYAYARWEEAGKPVGMSDYFWKLGRDYYLSRRK